MPPLQTHPPTGPLAWFGVYPQALPGRVMPPEKTGKRCASTKPGRTGQRAALDTIRQAIPAAIWTRSPATAPHLVGPAGRQQRNRPVCCRNVPSRVAMRCTRDAGAEQVLAQCRPSCFRPAGDSSLLTCPMAGKPQGGHTQRDAARRRAARASPRRAGERMTWICCATTCRVSPSPTA